MDVANVINQADNSRGEEKASLANKVMAYYHDLQLTDEPMTFTASTPADELNRQLYYWTGEYFYDSQDYDRAIDFASRALPLCRNTEMEADCLNLLALSHFRMSNCTQVSAITSRVTTSRLPSTPNFAISSTNKPATPT